MARTTTPQAAPASPTVAVQAVADDDMPIEPFEAFNWAQNLPADARVCARSMADLVNKVIDVTQGAALVFELDCSRLMAIDAGERPYLSHVHTSALMRLARASLELLADDASRAAGRLNQLQEAEL
jgi:hypothetical protein